MADDLIHGVGAITSLRTSQAKSARAFRRKLCPAYCSLQKFRRFYPGEDNALRTAVKRAGNQRILDVGRSNNRSYVHEIGDAADILYCLDIEAPMLGIEKDPIETRGSVNASN